MMPFESLMFLRRLGNFQFKNHVIMTDDLADCDKNFMEQSTSVETRRQLPRTVIVPSYIPHVVQLHHSPNLRTVRWRCTV